MKFLFFIFTLLILNSCVVSTPGEGKKIGRIVKLERKGLFSKTMEGELIRGGITDGTGSMGISFLFTIENEYLMDIAQSAFENQTEVIIFYKTELFSSILRSECTEPHFVTKIAMVK